MADLKYKQHSMQQRKMHPESAMPQTEQKKEQPSRQHRKEDAHRQWQGSRAECLQAPGTKLHTRSRVGGGIENMQKCAHNRTKQQHMHKYAHAEWGAGQQRRWLQRRCQQRRCQQTIQTTQNEKEECTQKVQCHKPNKQGE